MKFSLFINKIKNYKNNFIKIDQIIYEVLIKLFPKLNNDDLNILIILTTFLLNIISNKYFINEIYWEENKQDVKAIVLLLLPYLYDYNFTDLNEILYSFTNCNKISSYILQLNKGDVLKQYFKYSNILLGIIDETPSTLLLLDDDNNDKLIYKFIEHNLIGLLQTLYIINGKSYINWINIIPININNYKQSKIYIHTINRLQYFSENISVETFLKIESDNLINYNGLWFGDFYNILRIKYFENFKDIKWLLIPINNERYLINDLNELFKLENILNLEYYNYNDLPQKEQNIFINIIMHIINILNLESYNNLIYLLNKLLLNFIKNNSNMLIKYQKYDNLLKIDIINIFKDIIKFKKIDIFWLYLKINIITNFKNSVYGKFLLTKQNNNYYFNNYYYYRTFSGTEYSINLYVLYNIIKNLITNDSTNLDLNYISLNIQNKYLFFKRIYYEKNIHTWLKLRTILPKDNYNENLKEIFKLFKEFYVNLVFEELILCGSLSEFVPINKKYNHNSIYYLTKDKYLDIAKEALWQKFYALNWISQIDFFHHYIYHQIIYITGATGQGKTTQVPKLLLYASLVIDYKLNPKIVCSEPRIAPTIDNAIRVADELGVPIFNNLKNKTNNYYIQYKYKNDNHTGNSPNGFIKFTTDGTIVEEIMNNQLLFETKIIKTLESNKTKIYNKVLYDIYIIDEAHEHGVNMDILISIIRNACYINNKIKLVIVSATMDSDEPIYRRFFKYINDNLSYPIKNNLNNPFDNYNLFLPQPIYMDRRYHISPPGSTTRYEIIDNYLNIDLTLEEAEKEGIKKTLEICSNTLNGGILFFTVGEREIINIVKELNIKLPIDCIALPLYSKLNRKYSEIIAKININLYNIQYKKELIHLDWGSTFVERRDVQKGTYKRFVIVATNIAEASVTIPDLKYVVDTGFLKSNIYSYDTNTTNMITREISEVNRIQRRGRVGRINSGIVYYMYTYKSRENMKPFYKITESNIDNLILKLLSNKNILNKNIDPNIFSSYKNIFLIDNKLDNNDLINIFQNNYYINNKIISEIYFNIAIDTNIFYQGYSLDVLKDMTGDFYLIHPCENIIQRNILNKIINKFTNNYIINNLLINNLICKNSNNKTDLGIKIMKYGKEEINLNNRLNIYYANKYNCINEINEINIFLENINYSLLELSNVRWDEFTVVYNNYNSDIEFIFELIQKIKSTFNNLLNNIINLKTKTNILITIETIKNKFYLKEKNYISIELKNKLNGLINNGLFNNKYKSIIFNDSIIQNIFKKSIISENIIEWTERNLFKNDIILNFLNKLITNSFLITKEEINIIPIEIYSLNKMKQINDIFLLSYKNQIVNPYKNLTFNNISYEITYDRISRKSITVSKISYYEIIYVFSKLGLDNKINISIIINK